MRGSDYQTIADIIRTLPETFGMRRIVAHRFAERLKRTNQRFKADAFLKACGPIQQDDDE